MKKLTFYLVIGILIISNLSLTYKVTAATVNDPSQQIAILKAKVLELQLLLEQLLKVKPIATSATLGLLTQTLALGSNGDEVTTLQNYLAKNPIWYPEGIISGYFGQLTENAVKRLQRAEGLEETGSVGPNTRQLINKNLLTGNRTVTPPSQNNLPVIVPITTNNISSGNGCLDKKQDDDCITYGGEAGMCNNALNGHLLFCVPKH